MTHPLSPAEIGAALDIGRGPGLQDLMARAAALRDLGHGSQITWSRKVFIPLTHQCRDVCHYCTFARPPRPGQRCFLTPDEVLEIARQGAARSCKEALFTLGEKPELRWPAARAELDAMGFATTIDYLEHCAGLVLRETGLLPHLNPGLMTAEELARLRKVSVSMGIMLENASPRLFQRGGVHFGSPDKDPALRLACLEEAGRQNIPMTTGILIGIGETRQERIDSLIALRDLHARHGHIQEVIVQNFLPKPGTRMARTEAAARDDHLWTIAMARLILGPDMTVQAPPNLSPDATGELIAAGIDDWGGVSPVTIDHVNPEAPWPELDRLAAITAGAGKTLVERLALHPRYLQAADRWVDPAVRPAALRLQDGAALAREDDWITGLSQTPPRGASRLGSGAPDARAEALLDRARDTRRPWTETEVAGLFLTRGPDRDALFAAADALRREVSGDTVRYVVNRNINYTNVCTYSCSFCAFSKGKTHAHLRGPAYDIEMEELARRVREAWDRGATEVCLQGGIHPGYTGETYLRILRTVRAAAPAIHIHAFSPLEVQQGAATLGMPVAEYLAALRAEGLGTLPGTAAEVLDDEVRNLLCPDKLNTAQWLEIVETAHRQGLRTTATIMFGHVDRPVHWARHLLRLRALQERTGGFTEFVPLPFVAQEAPLFLRHGARPGPTFGEALAMHAVARLVLHPLIPNIQTSWVKMGPVGAALALAAGANDLGGTLMNESITRAAGATHGQEFPPDRIEALIAGIGRRACQRCTTYGAVPADRRAISFDAAPLAPVVNAPFRRPKAAPLPHHP